MARGACGGEVRDGALRRRVGESSMVKGSARRRSVRGSAAPVGEQLDSARHQGVSGWTAAGRVIALGAHKLEFNASLGDVQYQRGHRRREAYSAGRRAVRDGARRRAVRDGTAQCAVLREGDSARFRAARGMYLYKKCRVVDF
eukprot:6190006-Pleurochrysis_carterae.AAC.2